jgi:crotonobetainyl-CoA:carnitine CoA-transferase CaiB-like acyl-CoA transferase
MEQRPAGTRRLLEGVRVLELSALIAGPSCAKYLTDHGAQVIKIERYPMGDISRHSFTPGGALRSPMFIQQNAGKHSVCVDLKRPEGIAIVKDLVKLTDVVIEAFTPGVMARLGLGYDDLRHINPRLIMCSLSGFGQTGPNAQRPGYAHISHAMTGWLAMQFLHRDPPEEPRGPGIAIGDVIAGLTAFGAICAALYAREHTGEGEHIDIALFDALFGSNDLALQSYLLTNTVSVWYHPVHKVRDGYITANIGPDFRAWENVCKAMNRPDLLEDARFCTQSQVRENLPAATEIVRDWLAEHTCDEAIAALTDHHIACGMVYTVDQAVRQPQVRARELVVDVDDPLLGHIEVINSAFRYRNATSGVRGPAPLLGEHNAAVLENLLGYTPDRIKTLQENGVLRVEDL